MPRSSLLLRLALVLAAALAVYAPSFSNDYAMDDVPIVRDNPLVQELQPTRTYFERHYWHGAQESSDLYRPITIWSYALGKHVFAEMLGDAARVHHAGNILLHLLATILSLLLLRGLRLPAGAALAGTTVFALHALHSEVVAGIVGRAELLAFVGGALALIAGCSAARRRGVARIGLIALSTASFFVAFGSKESAVAWLPFVPFYVLACVARRTAGDAPGSVLRTSMVPMSCGSIALIAFLVLRSQALGTLTEPPEIYYPLNPLSGEDTATRVVTGTTLWGYGLYKTVLPFSLASDYGAHCVTLRSNLFDSVFLVVVAVLLGAITWGLWRPRRRPLAMIAIALFFGFGFLTSNILFPVGTIFAERLYYTPSLALSVLVAWWWERAASARWLWLAIAAWSVVCSVVIVNRNSVWHDNETLFLTDVDVQPCSARLRITAAGLLTRRGETERAFEHARAAVEIEPDYGQAWLNLGLLQMHANAMSDAEQSLKRARGARYQQREDFGAIASYLGQLLLRNGKPAEAIDVLEDAARERPQDVDIAIRLAQAMSAVGRGKDARNSLEALMNRPDLPPADIVRLIQAMSSLR